jgi:F-type H+-transporting ATPase subunit delta
MNYSRVAGRYAKSLLDLSLEQQKLDEVYADMMLLKSVCESNSDFVNMLKSPVIGGDKKIVMLDAITAGKISALTQAFLKLLVKKTREYSLPEIVTAFKHQYNTLKGIQPVKVTTAVPVSETTKLHLLQKIQQLTGNGQIELEMAVRDELIGGFTLQIGDTLVDASILRDLNDVKTQFKNNEFIHAIR